MYSARVYTNCNGETTKSDSIKLSLEDLQFFLARASKLCKQKITDLTQVRLGAYIVNGS